jgi:hypothetical protein
VWKPTRPAAGDERGQEDPAVLEESSTNAATAATMDSRCSSESSGKTGSEKNLVG